MLCIRIFKSVFKSMPVNLHFIEVADHMISYRLHKEWLQKSLLFFKMLSIFLCLFHGSVKHSVIYHSGFH